MFTTVKRDIAPALSQFARATVPVVVAATRAGAVAIAKSLSPEEKNTSPDSPDSPDSPPATAKELKRTKSSRNVVASVEAEPAEAHAGCVANLPTSHFAHFPWACCVLLPRVQLAFTLQHWLLRQKATAKTDDDSRRAEVLETHHVRVAHEHPPSLPPPPPPPLLPPSRQQQQAQPPAAEELDDDDDEEPEAPPRLRSMEFKECSDSDGRRGYSHAPPASTPPAALARLLRLLALRAVHVQRERTRPVLAPMHIGPNLPQLQVEALQIALSAGHCGAALPSGATLRSAGVCCCRRSPPHCGVPGQAVLGRSSRAEFPGGVPGRSSRAGSSRAEFPGGVPGRAVLREKWQQLTSYQRVLDRRISIKRKDQTVLGCTALQEHQILRNIGLSWGSAAHRGSAAQLHCARSAPSVPATCQPNVAAGDASCVHRGNLR